MRPLVLLLLLPALAHAQTQCWAPREEQDLSLKPASAAMRKIVLGAEALIQADQAFLDAPIPVRMRTTISIGSHPFDTARMHVNAYPEYASGSHIWRRKGCEVIEQADRVDAAIGQLAVFINPDARAMFPPGATFMPKFEGMVGGYPRYSGWIYMSRDGRLPWVPESVGQYLDRMIAEHERKLADWMKEARRGVPARDPALTDGLQQTIERIRDYRASFAPEELAAPAVWADEDHRKRDQLSARIQQLHQLAPEQQQAFDGYNRQGRALQRQALDVERAGNRDEAKRLRLEADGLFGKANAVRDAHRAQIAARISELGEEFDLVNVRPGDKEHAMGFVADPAIYENGAARVRVLAVLVSWGKNDEQNAWMKRAGAGFDFAALAKLLD